MHYKLYQLLSKRCELPVGHIGQYTTLTTDLHLDEPRFRQLVVDIRSKYEVPVQYEDVSKLKTVKQLYQLITQEEIVKYINQSMVA